MTSDPSRPASKARKKFGGVRTPDIDRSSDLQAIFLFLLAVASQSAVTQTSARIRLSFLLTAAGQFRISTGFPWLGNTQADR
jgi:hypothetical protein